MKKAIIDQILEKCANDLNELKSLADKIAKIVYKENSSAILSSDASSAEVLKNSSTLIDEFRRILSGSNIVAPNSNIELYNFIIQPLHMHDIQKGV